MNDLMTKSFLSYVELKKQAQKDNLESEIDIESGCCFNPTNELNLSQFFQEVYAVKVEMEEITNLLIDLQTLHNETKSTHSSKLVRGLRDRMESNIVAVLREAKTVKSRLESLDRSNQSDAYERGSLVDRTRISVSNGLRVKLREIMDEFQLLREKILSDYKADLKRRYYTATGDEPSEELIEKIILGGGEVQMFVGKEGVNVKNKDRHEAVMEIQRSLTKLQQVFLDMAVIVETQGEKMDNIEENVWNAGYSISGGTNSLYYANQMKKKTKAWVYWVWAVMMIILLVCIVSLLVT